eukprot:g30377.t1
MVLESSQRRGGKKRRREWLTDSRATEEIAMEASDDSQVDSRGGAGGQAGKQDDHCDGGRNSERGQTKTELAVRGQPERPDGSSNKLITTKGGGGDWFKKGPHVNLAGKKGQG